MSEPTENDLQELAYKCECGGFAFIARPGGWLECCACGGSVHIAAIDVEFDEHYKEKAGHDALN